MLVACVLCGGGGTRLWPLSRRDLPKPFAALPGFDKPLLRQTYERIAGIKPDAVLTIAAAEHLPLCMSAYAAAGVGAPHIAAGEPAARNTAAAVGVAAACAAARYGEDAVLAVFPADHYIGNAAAFCADAARAAEAARAGAVALAGIAPAHPAAGYGYIRRGDALQDGVFAVRAFYEKPDAAAAARLIAGGDVYWNAGMFFLTAKTAVRELRRHAPEIAAALPPAPAAGDKWILAQNAYDNMPAVSFDVAVAEKTDAAAVVAAAEWRWSDVGSWPALAQTLPADADGNRSSGDARLINCAGTFAAAAGGRLVVGVGLRDICVVDAPDAVLVAAADAAEHVRAAAAALADAGRREAHAPAFVQKPWGNYTILAAGDGYLVKRICVNAGAALSLQSHKHRAEYWTMVCGGAHVVIDERAFDLAAGESCYIPRGAKHRIANRGAQTAAFIEVQTGGTLSEDDIVRYADDYGRAET